MEEKSHFEVIFNNPDFFAYCKEDKTYFYSGLRKEIIEINDSVEQSSYFVTDDYKIEKGIKVINFVIDNVIYPFIMPIEYGIGFIKMMNLVHRFYGNFFEIVSNEIELRGNKIEKITESKVNKNTFSYLYRKVMFSKV